MFAKVNQGSRSSILCIAKIAWIDAFFQKKNTLIIFTNILRVLISCSKQDVVGHNRLVFPGSNVKKVDKLPKSYCLSLEKSMESIRTRWNKITERETLQMSFESPVIFSCRTIANSGLS